MRAGSWLPPAVWMVLILWLSSDTFSAPETASVLETLMRLVWPAIDPAILAVAHGLARKTAHLAVYAVLALLWWRGLRRDRLLTSAPAAWSALAISTVWAALDEMHQATVTSRTGSVADVAIDTLGAALAVASIRLAGGRRT